MTTKFTSKHFFLLIAVTLSSLSVNAQQVNYKILKDDPKDVTNMLLLLDIMHFDMGIKNIHGTSFNIGLTAMANYKERINGEVIFRYGWLTMGKLVGGKALRSHRQIELGGSYALRNKSKTKNTNVILSQSTSYVGDKKITTTKSIKIPATRVVALGARAGIYSLGGVFGTDDFAIAPDMINYGMTGIYAGLFQSTTYNVIINTDTDGKAGKSKRTRFYADALIVPIQNASLAGVDYKPVIGAGPIGFRVGMQAFPAEIRKLPNLDIKMSGMSFGAEVGMRPYDGIYISGNWSIAILRKKSTMLGYTKPETENRTTE